MKQQTIFSVPLIKYAQAAKRAERIRASWNYVGDGQGQKSGSHYRYSCRRRRKILDGIITNNAQLDDRVGGYSNSLDRHCCHRWFVGIGRRKKSFCIIFRVHRPGRRASRYGK